MPCASRVTPNITNPFNTPSGGKIGIKKIKKFLFAISKGDDTLKMNDDRREIL